MSNDVWLSYSLQDLLMFGPEVYLRLYIRLNQDLWPWQWPVLVLSLLVPVLLGRPEKSLRRLGWLTIGGAWVGCGAGFLLEYYGEINWPARYFGWLFIAQGLLIAILGLRTQIRGGLAQVHRQLAVIWWLAVILLPWVTVLESGNVLAVALFGLAPGVTVAATSLLVGTLNRRASWLLVLIPLLWIIFSAATFWVLQAYWLMLLPLAALCLIVAGYRLSPTSAQSPDRQSARPDPIR